MSTHPYWSYEAIPGGITEEAERAAVDEGRRAFVLELAVSDTDVDAVILARAKKFEAYLKGEAGSG